MTKIVHHHLIYQAKVGNKSLGADSEKELTAFLYELLNEIDMKCLIPARLEFSEQKAWTGLVGIITSHIAFHYWTVEKFVQLDIYSCKNFGKKKAITFLNNFWNATEVKALFIDRKVDGDFEVTRFEV